MLVNKRRFFDYVFTLVLNHQYMYIYIYMRALIIEHDYPLIINRYHPIYQCLLLVILA